MSERKWTPGPWGVKCGRVIHAAGGACVASTYVAAPQADAHLIAAAPDLYEALDLHVAFEAIPADRGGKAGPKGKAWAAFIAARDAALAKARGDA